MKKIIVILVMALALVPGAGLCEQANDTKQAGKLKSLKIAFWRKAPEESSINPFVISTEMRFVYIKPGTFEMGSDEGSLDETPIQKVSISQGFYMQTTELTKGQWFSVMKKMPWLGQDDILKSPDSPAVYISWDDVQIFIKKLNQKSGQQYRLPTEAEWEYACRAGSTAEYSFANERKIQDYAWYSQNAFFIDEGYAHLVAKKKPNAWGLFDMHGNVWEWCQDRHGEYHFGWLADPAGPSWGSHRVLRGGNWVSPSEDCRSAIRKKSSPKTRHAGYGFRLVSDFDPSM